jgi:uncharacterized protein (DUF736 family)
MPVIGYVTKQESGGFKGRLATLTIQVKVEITPNETKKAGNQPDFRVVAANGYEIGAGWRKTGETSGKEYVSLSLAAPEFGPRRLYANLARASGQDDADLYAVIWNPAD